MGIETAILLGITAMSAVGSFQASKAQAKATVAQGKVESERRARITKATVAKQKTSFLNSGLTLSGTPQDVFESTFDTGIADTKQIITNANRSSSNTMSSARTKLMTDVAQMGVTGFGAMGGFGAGADAGASISSTGQVTSTMGNPVSYSTGSNGMINF